MNWVTWENVGVDRMACGWLIRRFIDSEAAFSFVSAGSAVLPANHEPFDIPGVRLTHRHGHCTFDTILREYHLTDPTLRRLAAIIDEADTAQEEALEPIAPGLDFLCRGIRRLSLNDQAALDRGALLFEALYAELSSR
ncbi:MAG: chromate resistance protein [Anaerolineae bacterium]|nr:chromate resistance protein [Anaerolineae bacterium]